jgi:DnaJ-domain-containing protein 1
MKRKYAVDDNPGKPESPVQACEWPGCDEHGEHRAPKSRDEMNTYLWFCLAHIRQYNKSWNYYDGMNDSEVEQDKRHDTVWNRPSWQLGTNAGAFGFGSQADPFDLFGENGSNPGPGDHVPRPPVSKEEENAYRTLGLEYPVNADDIKSRYKALVKEHHPDANKGAKASEERLKDINQAYHVLREALVA